MYKYKVETFVVLSVTTTYYENKINCLPTIIRTLIQIKFPFCFQIFVPKLKWNIEEKTVRIYTGIVIIN